MMFPDQQVNVDDDGQITHEALWANLVLNSEIIITCDLAMVTTIKNGLKNVKARQASAQRQDGLVPISGVLSFDTKPSESIPGAIDLRCILTNKSTVKIHGIRIPDNEI